MSLVAFSDIKNFLGLNSSSESNYPALPTIIDSVDSAINNYCGRILESGEQVEIYYPTCASDKMIPLKALPVMEIESVVSDDVDITDSVKIKYYGIELPVFPIDDVVITYTGGYTIIPPAIQRAALVQIAYEWQTKDYVGATSISDAGGTVSRPELGLLKEVKRLCIEFKHPFMTN